MRKRTGSDKISYVKDLQSPQSLRKPTRTQERLILRLYDDGYTVHQISEYLPGLHCGQVANVVMEAIARDAARCA